MAMNKALQEVSNTLCEELLQKSIKDIATARYWDAASFETISVILGTPTPELPLEKNGGALSKNLTWKDVQQLLDECKKSINEL